MGVLSSKQSHKWFIIISFIGIILVPSMMPSPTFKTVSVISLGAICLLFEFLNLKNLDSKSESFKSETRQTWLLIGLTVILVVVNFLV